MRQLGLAAMAEKHFYNQIANSGFTGYAEHAVE